MDFGVSWESQAIGDCTNCLSDAEGAIVVLGQLVKCRTGEREMAVGLEFDVNPISDGVRNVAVLAVSLDLHGLLSFL